MANLSFMIADEDNATGGICLTDQGGFIYAHQDIKELIDGLILYYRNTSPEQIEKYNDNLHKKYFPKDLNVPPVTVTDKPKGIKYRPGYVYLLKGPDGHFKIGRTTKLKQRIDTLSVKLPFPIEHLHTIQSNDCVKAERHFHDHFAAKRGEGEWFALDQHDIEFFCSHENLDF